jgi:cholesterol transport system auxiliary component
LSTDDSNLQADYELGGRVIGLPDPVQRRGPEVLIQYNARLVRGSDQRIVAAKPL